MTAIRLATEADAPAIRAIYAPMVENAVVSFEADPPSEAETADRIADTRERYPWLVCEVGGGGGNGDGNDGDEGDRDGGDEDGDGDAEIAGYAYASRHRERAAYRWSVDVSVYVAEDHRRRGVGRGLYESLFAVLRSQNFYNAYAGIALPNEASVALHESLGFERVGVYESVGYRRGAWRDVGWWQLELRDRAEDPEDPRPLPAVEGTPAFEDAVSAGESTIGR